MLRFSEFSVVELLAKWYNNAIWHTRKVQKNLNYFSNTACLLFSYTGEFL